MSRYFSENYKNLTPYVPGEQPKDMQYIKLNTNESPFPPSAGVARAVAAESDLLQLYPDPDCSALCQKMAQLYGVKSTQVLMGNGSDEILNFAFMAFADAAHPLAFADITYGFYPVFANLYQIPYTEIALGEDFSINPRDYIAIGKTIVIANPNAPTGLYLPLSDIEQIVQSNPDNVVIIDEAYIDFGGQSAAVLIDKYDNLLVVGTFSKSRSMAGARLGFAIGNEQLIGDLTTLKYSVNPYNINRLTAVAGAQALEDNAYYMDHCQTIMETRAWTVAALQNLGFTVIPSCANFVFAASDAIDGKQLYLALKQEGVLIRHFEKDRIKNYNRITIGTQAQMELLIDKIQKIVKERAI